MWYKSFIARFFTIIAICIFLVSTFFSYVDKNFFFKTNAKDISSKNGDCDVYKKFRIYREIYKNDNGIRLKNVIKGDCSEIFFFKNKNVEKEILKNMLLCTQKRIFITNEKVMQEILYVYAKTATYGIPSNFIIANDVIMHTYEIEGKNLPNDIEKYIPKYTQKAENVVINFSKHSLFSFHAKNVNSKATKK